jgi:digeranylgeranylglycerophospholipid reductase
VTKSFQARQGPVAIVGASFAGLACAKALAEHGVDALVIERKNDPGEKLHTTGILVQDVVDEFDWLGDLPPNVARRVPGVRLYAPNLRSVDLEAPGYSFLATDTPALMRLMAERCEREGVKFRYGEPFVGAQPTPGGWRLAGGVESSYLVGADGPQSHVAKSLALGENSQFIFGVEYEYPGDLGENGRWLHCFLDRRLAPGYIGWIIAGVGAVQVGLARRLSNGDAAAAKRAMSEFLTKIAPIADFRKRAPASVRAGLIPCGGLVSPVARAHALLVGDAAGMTSPVTAGGIHTALRHGHAAGAAIADFVRGRGEDPAQWLPQTYPRFRAKRFLRWLFDHFQSDLAFNALLNSSLTRAAAEEIFFHKMERR